MSRDFIIAGVCFLLSVIWIGLLIVFQGGIDCALNFVLEKFKIESNDVTTFLCIVVATAIEVVFLLIMFPHIINIFETAGPVIELIGEIIAGCIDGAEICVAFYASLGRL